MLRHLDIRARRARRPPVYTKALGTQKPPSTQNRLAWRPSGAGRDRQRTTNEHEWTRRGNRRRRRWAQMGLWDGWDATPTGSWGYGGGCFPGVFDPRARGWVCSADLDGAASERLGMGRWDYWPGFLPVYLIHSRIQDCPSRTALREVRFLRSKTLPAALPQRSDLRSWKISLMLTAINWRMEGSR